VALLLSALPALGSVGAVACWSLVVPVICFVLLFFSYRILVLGKTTYL
jgi:hypothetical protein